MQTAQLYEVNSYKKHFFAHVIAQQDNWVALDRSYFYPTKGGQQHDMGSLNGLAVTDVKADAGVLWHQLEGELSPGAEVEGQLDWERRFRHMQRHTGQHIVSQAMLRLRPELATVSVSLQSPTCTIDTKGLISEEDLPRIESLANQALSANYPIHCFYIEDHELKDYPLRRPPKVKGKIRLVKMANWELSACGGTHLKSTAEVGVLKILGYERIKRGLTRLYLRAGLEALADYQQKHTVVEALRVKLSAQTGNIHEKVSILEAQAQEAASSLGLWQREYATLLAEKALANATVKNGVHIVRLELVEQQEAIIAPLAEAITAKPKTIALLAVPGVKPKLLFARGAEVDQNMNTLLQQVLPLIEGRGGGRADFARAGGSREEGLSEALDFALERCG